IIAERKAGVDGGLGEGGRHCEFGKTVIVEEERVQAFAQGIIRGEFNRQQVLTGSDLVVVYFEVPYDGDIVPQGHIGLKVQVAFEPLFLPPYVGGKLYILEAVTQA